MTDGIAISGQDGASGACRGGSSVRDVGIAEAIQLWLGGQKLDGFSLWSVSFVWWGRLAKGVTILAGLVVVIDLLGADRLRHWGEPLRTRPLHRLVKRAANSSWAEAGLLILLLLVGVGVQTVTDPYVQPFVAATDAAVSDSLGWASIGVAVALGVLAWTLGRGRRGVRTTLGVAASVVIIPLLLVVLLQFAAGLAVYLVTLAATFVVAWLLARGLDIGAGLLEITVIRPTAWLLEHEPDEKPIRWTALLVLVLGQVLDLLAS
ncbi:hypothetical protein [Actinomycetospora flava]|uniref:Uncharacterized protein n=1 Tax=Actinomycetospora flava TaxID=3129232 RepID=A0ABU8M5F0_9PSEU